MVVSVQQAVEVEARHLSFLASRIASASSRRTLRTYSASSRSALANSSVMALSRRYAALISSMSASLTTGDSSPRLQYPQCRSNLSGRNLRSGQATLLSYLGAAKGGGADCGRHRTA